MTNNNFHNYNTQFVLKNYFKDNKTYNFKHGLEFGLSQDLNGKATGNSLYNLDEDPTILGFDFVILNDSPLFNEVGGFLDFCDRNSIRDASKKRELYDDFVDHFAKMFYVDDSSRGEFKTDGRFNAFKAHYLNGVTGIQNLVHNIAIGNDQKKQMVNFGEDKLTFSLNEDVHLNSGYLSSVYRSLIYSKRNGRQLIPENLQRFDAVIIVSEIRNYNRITNYFRDEKQTVDLTGAREEGFFENTTADSFDYTPIRKQEDITQVLNDNVSRHIFTLYDCQLDFNKYSFNDDIKQGGMDSSMSFSEGLSFDMYYKFVSHEMEKFNFNPKYKNEEVKYLNNLNSDPTTYKGNTNNDSSINTNTNALRDDKFPSRPIDMEYRANTFETSEEIAKFEFDFPMIKKSYAKSLIEIRNKNLQTQANTGRLKSGINEIIDRANWQLQQRWIQERSTLLSDITQAIRGTLQLRNISAPRNIYTDNGLGQFVLDQIGNFANLGVSTVLGGGADYLTQRSKGLESALRGEADRLADNSAGRVGLPNPENAFRNNAPRTPNVYK